MILQSKPMSISEASEFVKKSDESEMKGFIKKFAKLNFKDAKELRTKLESLELMKMRDTQLVKVIDLMPESAEELNKIFVDVSLDEDETKKILETVKEFK